MPEKSTQTAFCGCPAASPARDADAAFDRLTALACDILGVSFAAIGIIKDTCICLKSAVGTEYATVGRTDRLDTLFLVDRADREEHDRSHDESQHEPLDVPGLPTLYFHMAIALVAPDGRHIGTFVIAHDAARPPFDENEQAHWQRLADIAAHELAQREKIARLEAEQRKAKHAERNIEMALELSNMATWQLDLASGKVTWGGAYHSVWGMDGETIPDTDEQAFALIHPDDRVTVREALDRAIAEDDEHYDIEFRITSRSGEVRWLAGRGDWVRLRDRDTLTGINFDITDIVRQQERNLLHSRELHHRLRNLFAKVQSIMNLTRQSASSVDDYIDRVSGRLRALERAQQILLAANFMSGSLSALVNELTSSDHRISAQGNSVDLGENAIVSLSLILNELVSNAARYGALTDSEGRVSIEWTITDNCLQLLWQEHNSAPMIALDDDMVTGFGSALIDQSIRSNLNGSITREWRSAGLVCTLKFPLEQQYDATAS